MQLSTRTVLGWCLVAATALSSAAVGDSVKTITLPSVTADLPDGLGRKVVLDRCVTCHTARYITNQPRFSRDTWVAEVQKMRKTFGAPVADEQMDDIVNYLMSIRGTPEPASKP